MRILAGLLAALLVLAPAPRQVMADTEIVLDDDAPSVQSTGSWAASTITSGFFGNGYHYKVAGDGSSTFSWPFPSGSPAAQYQVFARWTSGPNRASNATYVITHAAGATAVSVDQRSNGGAWQSLGTFNFSGAAGQGVRLSDKADGIVIADAIRWLPAGANAAATTATTTTPPPSTTTTTTGTATTTQPPSTAPAMAQLATTQTTTAQAASQTTEAQTTTPPPTGTTTTPPTGTTTTPPTTAATPSTTAATPSTTATTQAPPAAASADPRFFSQTQFRVDRDSFWDFFQKRGGVRTFGYPVSRSFTFFGCDTQLFQRIAMQQCGGNGVSTLNLLDDGLLPYNRFHGSTVPMPDPQLISAAPLPSDPNYGSKAIDFVKANAPDTFQGEPVNFFGTFSSTVSLSDAFPQGNGDSGLLPLLNLQLWGMPTSAPAVDPNNHDFIYLRFQRGVMHYDKGCKCTQALLLADYLKSLLTGNLLPDDLAAQAANSPLLRAVPSHRDLHATVFGDAFTVQVPVAAPTPAASTPIDASSPDYGMSAFLWGHPDTTGRDLKLITDLGFRWQKTLFQWRSMEGACKGCFDWTEADRVVKASATAGVQTIARLDFQPAWARRDGATNGPPDNYQDYADFVTAFMTRYSSVSTIGRVAAIEVWNEVNLDREWGGATITQQQAADYVRLLSGAYMAAKTADPGVTIISAGLSPTGVTNGHSADDATYLQWLFDAGLKGHYDVLGAHGNTQAPEVDVAPGSLKDFPHPSFYFRRIEQLRDVMVKNGDADKRVWLLEFGWTSDSLHPNYAWFAVSEDKKASNIVRALQYARQNWQPWIGVMTLWTLPDPSWTTDREEYWWAITNADGTPRAAYTSLLQARRSGQLAGIPAGL